MVGAESPPKAYAARQRETFAMMGGTRWLGTRSLGTRGGDVELGAGQVAHAPSGVCLLPPRAKYAVDGVDGPKPTRMLRLAS